MTHSFYVCTRGHNDPQTARTPKGTRIFRQKGLFLPTYEDNPLGGYKGVSGYPLHYFECMPYDTHFVYENPDILPGVTLPDVPNTYHMCTCGSPAAVVYGDDLPLEYKYKMACLYEVKMWEMYGKKGEHVTSRVNVSDFLDLFGGRTFDLEAPAGKDDGTKNKTIFLPNQ